VIILEVRSISVSRIAHLEPVLLLELGNEIKVSENETIETTRSCSHTAKPAYLLVLDSQISFIFRFPRSRGSCCILIDAGSVLDERNVEREG